MSKTKKLTTEQFWNKQAQVLVGKKVKIARYMTEKEAEDMGFYSRAVVLEFEDGSFVFPSRDDEGNDVGALFGGDGKGNNMDFPVIS